MEGEKKQQNNNNKINYFYCECLLVCIGNFEYSIAFEFVDCLWTRLDMHTELHVHAQCTPLFPLIFIQNSSIKSHFSLIKFP